MMALAVKFGAKCFPQSAFAESWGPFRLAVSAQG